MKGYLITSMALAGTFALSACNDTGAPGAADPASTRTDSAEVLTLSTVAASTTRIKLNWDGPSGAGGTYQIYRDGEVINAAADGHGGATDTGLSPGTRYCYQIVAVNRAGSGAASSNKSCVTTAALAGWNMQRIPEGPPLSLALDSRGLERLGYCSRWNGVIYQARQTDGSWNMTVVDPGATCFEVRLAVGSDGSAHMIYADSGSNTLKYASDATGSWVVSDVPGAAGAEFYVMAVDNTDRVHVAYQLFTGQAPDGFNIVHATNASGTWTSQVVAQAAVDPALAVDGAGAVHLAFLGAQAVDGSYPVHYLSDVSGAWTDAIVATSPDPRSLVALTVDSAGHAYLAYKAYTDLEYTDDSSGSWQSARVDSFDTDLDGDVYQTYDVAIALDSSQLPHMSYEDNGGNLKYLSPNGHGWDVVYVDTEGTQNQLCMDAAGHAHISYAETDNLYSKLAVSP